MRRPPGALRATFLSVVACATVLSPSLALASAQPHSPTTPPTRAAAPIGVVRVVLSEQRAYVYGQDRRLIATLLVSTGLNDSTPTGRFKVFSKSALTYYTPNPGEKMRWMVRFIKSPTGAHIGFHSIPFRVKNGREIKFPTPVGVAPSSHGCVRVTDTDAKWLFDNMTLGTIVIVQRTRASSHTL